MSISLQKGQKISLTKDNAGLNNILVGLGWDEVERKKRGFFSAKPQDIDCDASALLLSDGKLTKKSDVVYFGNLQHTSGAVRHMGDNLTGAGEGDDEQILIKLKEVPAEIDKIIIVVNIYQARQRQQHFGLIRNAFIRIVDGNSNAEMCRFNLSEDYTDMTALIVAEIYKYGNEWKFNPIGQGTKDGSLTDLVNKYK